jgi:DNA topoisomerase VI subunit A
MQEKAEMESLSRFGFDFIHKHYIPEKIRRGEFI